MKFPTPPTIQFLPSEIHYRSESLESARHSPPLATLGAINISAIQVRRILFENIPVTMCERHGRDKPSETHLMAKLSATWPQNGFMELDNGLLPASGK